MIRILICDDDLLFLKNMKKHVETTLKQIGIAAKIHTFHSMEEIGAPILASCDIAFLDIDFEQVKYNGLDIAKKLRAVRKDASIIFVTNYIEYAPEGYEVQAFRYVLKKDLQDKLQEYLQLAVAQLNESGETLKIKINGEIIDIPLNSILYIEAQLRTVLIYVQKKNNTKQYSCYAAISELERQLEQQGFLRIQKSYLVSMRHLKRFQCHEAELDNGIILKVSEKNYAEQKKKYLLWKGC